MRFTYPDRVLVQFKDHSSEGVVMDSRINRRWDRIRRRMMPYEIVYLVSFGSGCGCWYSEDELERVDVE